MKHIVIVTPYFSPAWSYGGPPRVLYTLAKALVQHDIHVTVVTSDSGGDTRITKKYEVSEGIEIHRFSVLSNRLAYCAKIFYIPFLLKKTEYILESADIVLFSDTRSLLSWQTYSFLLRKKIPYGIFPYGQIAYDDSLKKCVKKAFDVLWARHFFSSAHWIFCQTRHEIFLTQKHFSISPNKTHLLPLPVELPPSVPRKNRKILDDLQIPHHAKILIYVGRFHRLKGIELLFKSVFPLLQKDKNLHFLLIGRDDGFLSTMKKKIPRSLEKQVHISNPMYGEQLREIYVQCRCFVHTPQYYEETSTAALEALSCECPVVTTEYADIPYLDTYQAGIIAQANTKSIQFALLSMVQRKRTGRISRIIRERYTSGSIAEKLIQYLG